MLLKVSHRLNPEKFYRFTPVVVDSNFILLGFCGVKSITVSGRYSSKSPVHHRYEIIFFSIVRIVIIIPLRHVSHSSIFVAVESTWTLIDTSIIEPGEIQRLMYQLVQ